MKANLSNWRQVRHWESGVRQRLHQQHWLWLHGLCLGALVMLTMWLTAHLQMVLGSESLAVRYLLTLGVGYLAYLGLLRLWAAALLRRESFLPDPGGNLPVPGSGANPNAAPGDIAPVFESGNGGDFGGGGASGDFSVGAESADGLKDAALGAAEVAAGADDAIVVVVPVVAVFLIASAVVFGAGSLLWMYFGWEALLAVAVELAFTYASALTAVKVMREGWLTAAVRLTWKPLLGALACAVVLGATIDYFLPAARSLPHAIALIQAAR